MRLRLRLAALAGTGVMVAGASLASAPPKVSAAVPPTDAVVFTGDAGSLNPPVKIGPAQTGTYAFSGSGVCVDEGVVCSTVAAIVSNGAYVNNANSCGSGTATSSTSAVNTVQAGTDVDDVAYTIAFFAGIGRFNSGTVSERAPESGSSSVDTIFSVVTIVPTGGDCIHGVVDFTVNGEAVSTVG
jgi:hypothetical protein